MKLLSFFSFSDIHITDKESPAQRIYFGYKDYKYRESADYSGIILSTTHVLDAAVQTINAIHKKDPFDFGISLGDACNNTQYNELKWYADVLDGKWITPSSGAHKGAKTIGYQKPYQAAGLDPSLPWYQVIGNHDQSWSGAVLPDKYIKKTLVGSRVLNLGPIPPVDLSSRGLLHRGRRRLDAVRDRRRRGADRPTSTSRRRSPPTRSAAPSPSRRGCASS